MISQKREKRIDEIEIKNALGAEGAANLAVKDMPLFRGKVIKQHLKIVLGRD